MKSRLLKISARLLTVWLVRDSTSRKSKIPLTRFHLVQLLVDGLVLLVLRPHFQPFIQDSEGDINRQIAADNKLLKEIKARITRIYNWTKEQAEEDQPQDGGSLVARLYLTVILPAAFAIRNAVALAVQVINFPALRPPDSHGRCRQSDGTAGHCYGEGRY